jgi:UDP-glucose 4-epimerase
MTTNLLVTGGAGYIGSHVVDLLVSRGYRVTVFDNLSSGYRGAIHPEATLIQGDLLDIAAVRAAFALQAFDGVFHFASHIQVGESMVKPWLYLRDNVAATANLLEAMVDAGVRRFILSSTAALFDQPTRIPIPADEPIQPGSPYGESKAIAERYLHWMDRVYGVTYGALRYFNAAGAHPLGHIGEAHQPETHLIPRVLQVALGQHASINVFGDDYETPDGTAIRDYIHVIDLAEAHLLTFEALADGRSRHYNLGNGAGYSVKEVIDVARQVTGHPIPVTMGPRRAGDLARLVADSSAIREELGWAPEFADLRQIVATAWAWHQSHPNGYEK